MNILCYLFLSILTCIACCYDAKYQKVPNVLCFPMILLGLVYTFYFYGISVTLIKVLLLIAIFLIGIFPVMGLGDIKLWMAISTVIPFIHSVYIIGTAAFLFVVVSFICKPKESFNIAKYTFLSILMTKRTTIIEQESRAFAPYIFCATMLYIALC